MQEAPMQRPQQPPGRFVMDGSNSLGGGDAAPPPMDMRAEYLRRMGAMHPAQMQRGGPGAWPIGVGGGLMGGVQPQALQAPGGPPPQMGGGGMGMRTPFGVSAQPMQPQQGGGLPRQRPLSLPQQQPGFGGVRAFAR